MTFMTFTRRKVRLEFSYKMGTNNLDRVETVFDLGILLDEKLLIGEANCLLGFIKKRRAKEFDNVGILNGG
jgi:hypothetical protein